MKIFIGYPTQTEGKFASRLAQHLSHAKFEVLRDQSTIPPGEPIQEEVLRMIDASDAAVLVVSRDSVNRRWTRWEAEIISNRRLPSVVVLREQLSKEELGPHLSPLRQVCWLPRHDGKSDRRDDHLWEIHEGLHGRGPGPEPWCAEWRRRVANHRQDPSFRILHLSDLHFGDKNVDEILTAAEQAITPLGPPDLVVVSGDVSDGASRTALLRARGWLTNETGVDLGGKGRTSGLRLDDTKVHVIPGNHDAAAPPQIGKPVERRHHALESFADAFGKEPFPRFSWSSKNGIDVYLACLDTSFVGDRGNAAHKGGRVSKSDAAKLLLAQTQQLVDKYHQGIRGELELGGRRIVAAAFAASVKIAVMHHAIVDRRGRDSDLENNVRDRALRDLALANFNVVLSGHRHHSEHEDLGIGTLHRRKERSRLVLEAYCRAMAIPSEVPRDPRGKKQLRMFALLLRTLGVRGAIANRTPEQIVGRLKKAFKGGRVLRSKLMDMLTSDEEPAVTSNDQPQTTSDGEPSAPRVVPVTAEHLEQVAAAAQRLLSSEERIELRDRASTIMGDVLREFEKRRFVHAMAGSTIVHRDTHHPRAFKLYRIEKNPNNGGETLFSVEEFRHSGTVFAHDGLRPRTTYSLVDERQQSFAYLKE